MDNPDVTVLLVLNGAGVEDTWQLSDVITSLKRKRGLLNTTTTSNTTTTNNISTNYKDEINPKKAIRIR
jgi:hypothetical protein